MSNRLLDVGYPEGAAARHDQCDVDWQRLAVHQHLGNRRVGGDLRLDPFRIDVAPKGGNELIFLAAQNAQITILQLADITGRPLVHGQWWLAEITQRAGAAHHDFAVFCQANLHVWQRLADGARAVLARAVQTHHRGALGQAVAFEHRQAVLGGAFQQ